jgi:hypothetical protein
MTISGFSFARNADTLGYPIAESILSILPICDEFVIAIGKGNAADHTREIVAQINDPKIRIIDTEWTDRDTLKNAIYSQQTNIALDACTKDWCFYIQADEVVHEKYLPIIRSRCEQLTSDTSIEGLLFSYCHFWGDYDHYQRGHAWYPFEIRIIRNHMGVRSMGDAQSFRRNNEKLHVALANAEMFHYGYVRHPSLMQTRNVEIETTYRGSAGAQAYYAGKPQVFDFGPLNKRAKFNGTHPAVLDKRISEMNWKDLLTYSGPDHTSYHHDKLKYRILSFLENTFLGGKQIGGYRNYILHKDR